MRKKRLLMFATLLVAWLLFPAVIRADVYLDEDFDDPSFTSGVPSGWDNSEGTTSNSEHKWRRYTPGFEGACLRFNSYANYNGNTNILKTPSFTLPAGSNLSLNFKFKNSTGGDFSVYVKSAAATDAVLLASGLEADVWTDAEYSLASYAGQTIHIEFHSTSNYGNGDAYHYLDNVTVKDPPLCAQPVDLAISSLSQTSVTIHWTLANASADPDKYQIKVTKVSDGSVAFSDNNLVSADFSTTISSLEPGVEYNLTLRSDCSNAYKGFSEYSEPLRFVTLLNPITLPYEQNFNAESRVPLEILYSGNVSVTSSPAYGNDGNALKISSETSKSGMVVLPQMNHDVNDIQFAAFVRSTSSNAKYSIGFMADPLDPSTFMPIYEDSLPKSGQWYDIRFNTAGKNLSLSNQSIAIMVPDGESLSVYFDEIRISSIPSCPRPERLTVSSIDSMKATVSWEGNASPVSRQVRIMTASDTTVRNLTSNPAVLNNLIPNTVYTIQVRDVCSASDSSEWSIPASFKTLCGVLSNPLFSADFENMRIPECWVQRQTVKPTGTYGTDYGDEAWAFYDHYTYGNVLSLKSSKAGAHTLLITQAILVDQPGKYDLLISMYRGDNTDPNEGVAIWVNNTPDTVGGQKCGYIPGGYKFEPAEDFTGWYDYEFNIQKSGVVYVMLEGISQYGYTLYLDDINVVLAPTCRKIDAKSFSLSDITTTSVKLSWTPNPSSQSTVLRYRLDTGDNSVFDTVVVPVAQSHFDITSLTQATQYNLYCEVAAYCGGSDTSEWVSFSSTFATECENLDLPVRADFEDGIVPPLCWSQFSDGMKDYWQVNFTSTYVKYGRNSVKMVINSADVHPLLISPKINFGTDDYQLKFYMYRRTKDYYDDNDTIEGIKVWVNDTPDTVGGTQLCYIVANKDVAPVASVGMQEYIFDFNFPAAGVGYVIFEGIGRNNNSIYLDDIVVRKRPTCLEISSDFTATPTSDTSVVVSLVDETITDWQVEYGPAGYTVGEGTKVNSASASTITVSGLQPKTLYDFHIRHVCGAEYSDWTVEYETAKTFYAPFVITAENEYFEDFESYDNKQNITEYFIDVPKPGYTIKPSTALRKDSSSYYFIQAYDGERFSCQNFSYYQVRYIPVILQAGKNYEVSGYFVQDDTDEMDTKVSLLLSTTLVYDATELVSAYVADEWKYVQGYFNVPADGMYYVGVKIEQNSSPYRSGMDNLRIREMNCIPPTSSFVSATTTNSANVSWVSEATEWEIKVTNVMSDDFNGNDGVVFNDTVTTKSVDITGLTQNTEYYYVLRSICDGTPSDWTAPKSFRTQCDAVAVPYFLDFEGNQLDKLLCWTILGDNSYVNFSSNSKNGTGALMVEKSDLISPQINVASLANYMITGWVRSNTDSVSFAVGVMTDPSDITTFEPMGTVMIPVKNTWQEFTTFFNLLSDPDYSYVAGAKYVVLSVNAEDATFYFDDVLIDEIPTCPKPTEPEITNIGIRSFDMTWRANAGESQWRIVLESSGVVKVDTVVNSNNVTIDNLTGNTTYDILLRAICSASDTSAVTSCGSVTTLCDDYTLPFMMNIRDDSSTLPACWSKGAGNSSSYVDWRIVSVDNGYVLKYNDYSYSTKYYSSILTPVIDMTDATSAVIETEVQNYQADTLFYIIHDLTASVTDTVGYVNTTNVKEKKRYDFNVSQYVGSKIQIELKALAGSYYGSEIQLYSLKVMEVNPCSRPTGLNLISADESSFELEVADTAASHTAWEYVIGTSGFDYLSATPVLVNANQFTVESLSGKTKYDVYVRAVCGTSEYSDWAGPFTFETTCAAYTVPYYEGFEDYTTSTMSDGCFSFVNEYATGDYPKSTITSYTYVSEGGKALQMHSSVYEPLYFLLPEFDAPLNTLKMRFDYRNEGTSTINGTLIVGVMSSADMSTFVPIYTCPKTTVITRVNIAFDTVAAVAGSYSGRIAFKYVGGSSNNYYCGLDAIKVISLEDCSPVEQINVLETDNDAVTLEFISELEAPQYQVAYGIGATTPEECTAKVVVDNDTAVVSGLQKGAFYTMFVRSICAVGDTAVWSEGKMVQTLCDDYILNKGDRYVENFDEYGDDGFPSCMYRLQTSESSGVEYPVLSKANALNGTHCLNLNGINAVVLPKFSVPAEQLMISFNVKGSGYLYIGATDYYNIDSVSQIKSYYLSSSNSIKVEDLSLSGDVDGDVIVLYTKSATASAYIDSLVVEWAPTCYEPRNIKVENKTDVSATIVWRGAPDATKFECELFGLTIPDTTTYVVTTDTLNLSGLIAATNYTVRIRTICGTTDTTDWESVEFRTETTPAVVPYVADFENAEDNRMWTFVNASYYSDEFIIGKDPAGVKSGTKALYVSNNDSAYRYTGPEYGYYDYERETFFAYRTITLESGQYSYKMDWKGKGVNYYNFGALFVMPKGANLYAGYTSYALNYNSLNDDLQGQEQWATDSGTFFIDETGVYQLVVAWDQNDEPMSSTPLAVDNIEIEKLPCSNVLNAKLVYATANEALVTFVNPNDGKLTEYYYINGTDTSEVATVTNDTVLITGLTALTDYTLVLRSDCGDFVSGNVSLEFTTGCLPIVVDKDNPYFEGFEDYTVDNCSLDVCWIGNYSSYKKFEVRTQSDTYYREPYEGDNYVTMQWGGRGSACRDFQLEGGKNYSISFMTRLDMDKSDCYAKIVMRKGGLDSVLVSVPLTDEWIEVSHELVVPETGVYTLGFAVELTSSPYYACVDNFAVEQLLWGTPQNLQVTDVTATTADFTWTGLSNDYQIQILNGSMVVVDDTVTAKSFHAESLSPATQYTVKVRSNENGGTSKWLSAKFSTECDIVSVPYIQTFSDLSVIVPICWDAESGSSGTGLIKWTNSEFSGDSLLYLNVSSATGRNMIKSNAVYIDDASSLLSFEYKNTSSNDTLVVLLSSDNGATFADTLLVAPRTPEESVFTYNLQNYQGDTIMVAFLVDASTTGSGNYVYIDNFRINCKSDDVIRNASICPGEPHFAYGFNIPAISESGNYEFVRLHPATVVGECDYVEKLILHVKGGGTIELHETICEGDVYTSEAFPNPITKPGQYVRTLTSSEGCDSTIRLTLTVANPRYSYTHTICDNETYEFGGRELSKAGVYTDTIETGTQCDSIVTLTLNVLQTRFESSKTICEGDTYQWLDTTLATTGVYERRYKNSIGCDSVIVINLTVLDREFTVDSTICAGQSVQFGTNTYTESGSYTVTFENYLKCDSIVTLNLTVIAPDTVDIEDFACEGYTYFGNGYQDLVVTQDTVLYKSVKDKDGCLSVTRLTLDFVETIYVDTTITIAEGEVYNFCGNSLSEAGEYECVEKSALGCDSVVVLTLQIGSGLNSVNVQSLVLAPNPVRRGEVTYVHRDWTADEQRGMVVELVNSLGQVISRETVDEFPIAVRSIDISGVYYVRIITGTGEVYIGNLVVK